MAVDRTLSRSSWLPALTLAERAVVLRGAPHCRGEPAAPGAAALQRYERWRAQPPFGDDVLFQRRLASDGLTESTFLEILGVALDQLAAGPIDDTPWSVALDAAASRPCSSEPLALPPKFSGVPTAGFLELARPLIAGGRGRLRANAAELASAVTAPLFDPRTIDGCLAPALAEPLLLILMRTMVLELNVARLQGQLAGATPRERFDDFVARLGQPEVASALLAEYPVLARHLAQRVTSWVEVGDELMRNLIADAPAIRATFCVEGDPGPLIAFDGNAGDGHRGGRSVGIATFRSGLRLVYKPKSLAIDAHFQDLLAWLNARGADPAFRVLRVLDRGDHGWMEFVADGPCRSASELARFYARQGANLALLYTLGASDFHFENVIASGEDPVLIDLEALFRPLFEEERATTTVMKESVFRTNLLPLYLSAGGDYAGMDISGLGSPAGMLTAQKVADWDAPFEDSMRLVRRRVRMRGGVNQPTLDGQPVTLEAHRDDLVRGFDAMYALLISEREGLLAPDGPIAQFASDDARIIIRDTRAYMQLLGELFHPDALRDALEQDRLLDHLWAQVPKASHLAHFVPAERAALARGDVPLFSFVTDGMDVRSESGERIAGLVAESGLECARRRLRQLGERDHQRQRWCIDAALASIANDAGSAGAAAPGVRPGARLAQDRPVRARLLDAARAIADRIASGAFVDRDTIGWHVLRQIDERYWTVNASGLELYSGLPGIALFLAQLERVAGDERHAGLTRQCVASLRRAISAAPSSFTSVGGFEGWGGVVYALTQLAHALDDRALLAEAQAVVAMLPPLIAKDERLDIVGGSAGCLASLLALHRVAPSPSVLAAAIACGDRLVERAQPQAGGLGWRTPIAPDQPLCGVSHGASGIAGALLALFSVTGDPRYRAAAAGAFRYEQSQWSAPDEAWRDLRAGAAATTCAWCHGAPGIGLVRIRALALLDEPALRDDVERAVAATVRCGFGHNHSLCHGDLGNAELLLEASQWLAEPSARAALELAQHAILDGLADRGPVCATPRQIETPGLMLGLAGIGYGLLRLAAPERVPSVLLLDGPKEPR